MKNDRTAEPLPFDDAEFDGEQLLKEFLQAKETGQISPFPKELDSKFRTLIHKTFFKKKKKSFLSFIPKAASIALTAAAVGCILFSPAIALRTPMCNFVFPTDRGYYSVLISQTAPSTHLPSNTEQLEMRKKSPLDGLIPEGYVLNHIIVSETQSFYCSYRDKTGRTISFIAESAAGTNHFDSENADVSQVKIWEHDGILVIKNGYHFRWVDVSSGIFYHLHLPNMDYGDAWSITETVAKCPDWISLVYNEL